MRHLAEYIALAVVALPFVILPRKLALRCGEAMGVFFYHVLKKRRVTTVGNIRTALERGILTDIRTPEAIARECFRNVGRTLAEIARLSYGLDKDQIGRIRIEGIENIEAALEKGKGFLGLTGHFGNWELVGMAIPSRLHIPTGVARRQKNPYIDRTIIRNRESLGGEVVYKEGAVRQFLRTLKNGKGVLVIMDEPVSPDVGTPVDFMGYRAGFHKTAYSLSRRYDVPVVPFVMWHEGQGRHVIRVYPEMEMTGDELSDARRIAEFLEGYVSEHPSQWLQWFRKWTWAREKDGGTA
jgi:KDO2-lipid IV(A) lauroyltransferase